MIIRGSRSRSRLVALAAVALLAGGAAPALAQNSLLETRLRKIEADLRALQRQTPSDGKTFAPEISRQPTTAAGPEATGATPVTNLLSRMDLVEAQLKQLTAQTEENANRLSRIETRLGPAPAPAAEGPEQATVPPESVPATTAANTNLAAMTGGASAPTPAPAPATAPSVAATPKRPAATAGPSAQRLAAVRAIEKPQTDDAGDDEYSYGFRLWDAKFYPEAQQQLAMMIDKYPRHARISFARNLLGRAYLDDGKPREAATWFLQNYQAGKNGDRAPDSLLYLAEAMRQLKDNKRACIALSEFSSTYPREAAGRLKAQYDATRGGVKCN